MVAQCPVVGCDAVLFWDLSGEMARPVGECDLSIFGCFEPLKPSEIKPSSPMITIRCAFTALHTARNNKINRAFMRIIA